MVVPADDSSFDSRSEWDGIGSIREVTYSRRPSSHSNSTFLLLSFFLFSCWLITPGLLIVPLCCAKGDSRPCADERESNDVTCPDVEPFRASSIHSADAERAT